VAQQLGAGQSRSCPGNGTHPKRSSNICERLSSTPVASSGSPSRNAGVVSEWRAVLHAQRSAGPHGMLAEALQHGPSTQQSRGAATRSRNHPACELRANMVGGTKTPGWSPLHDPPGGVPIEAVVPRLLMRQLANSSMSRM